MKTFICHFGGGVSCKLSVTDEPPPNGQTHIIGAEWTGRVRPRHIRSYAKWTRTINQQLADEWGKRLLYVLQIAPGIWESWLFVPGGKPTQVKGGC